MARLLELEEHNAGAIVIAVGAEVRRPDVIHRGIPLHTPGANIEATVYEVLSPIETGYHPETYGSRLKVLATNDPLTRPGSVTHVDGQFRNFVGDERVARELRLAGASIKTRTDREGKVTGVEVRRGPVPGVRAGGQGGEVFTFSGEKLVPPRIGDPAITRPRVGRG